MKNNSVCILILISLLQAKVFAESDNLYKIKKLSNYEIGEKILNRYMRMQSTAKRKWEYNWTNGVALYGTHNFLRSVRDNGTRVDAKKVIHYIDSFQRVMDFQVERGLPEVTAPDLTAMSLGALSFMSVVEDCPSCEKINDNTLTYFATEPLNWVGAYDHVGKRYRIPELPFPPRWLLGSCIFIDSAMAYIPEGVRIAIRRGDEKALDFFLNQYEIFHKNLYVERTGLYKQAFYPYLNRKDPKNWTWSRGNMYMALGLLDTLEILPENHKRYHVLKERVNALLESVAKYVNLEHGMKTLTDDPSRDNYYESSSSAFFVANVLKASRLNILDDSSLVMSAKTLGENLKKYLKIESDNEISVNQVSGATTAFYPDWYYKHIIKPTKDRTTGIGAYMLMLSELIELNSER